MLPALKQAGVVDSGSYGFVVIIKAMRDYLLNNEYETMEKEVSTCDFELNLILNKNTDFVGENKLDNVKEELSKLGELEEFIEQNKILKVRIISKDNELKYLKEQTIPKEDYIQLQNELNRKNDKIKRLEEINAFFNELQEEQEAYDTVEVTPPFRLEKK